MASSSASSSKSKYKQYLDPYISQAQNDNLTPAQKVEDLNKLVQRVQIGMLTTRASDGQLHARAMTLIEPYEYSKSPINLVFIANNASPKVKEILNDNHVHVSFLDPFTTDWASYSGTARVIDDDDLFLTKRMEPYFGDLSECIHKGDENDSRVATIEIVPDEVRYWLASGSISSSLQIASILRGQGKVATKGKLRTITKQEIELINERKKSKQSA